VLRRRPMLSRLVLTRLSPAVLAVAFGLAGCQRQPSAQPVEPAPAVSQPAPASAPLAPAALDRAGLLKALELAASAYASGQATTANEDVTDRRFIVRQAFGCSGPSTAATPGLARWTWGRDGQSIEISLTPADWSADPMFTGAASDWEAVEGFWIARPWMRAAGCPSVAQREAAKQPAGQGARQADRAPAPVLPVGQSPYSMGLAAVFDEGGSRVGRRDGKPFTFTLRTEERTPPSAPARGFQLVVEGRLTSFTGDRAIRCVAPSADVRPVCIAAAEVDRVAFEDADGALLREWRPG